MPGLRNAKHHTHSLEVVKEKRLLTKKCKPDCFEHPYMANFEAIKLKLIWNEWFHYSPERGAKLHCRKLRYCFSNCGYACMPPLSTGSKNNRSLSQKGLVKEVFLVECLCFKGLKIVPFQHFLMNNRYHFYCNLIDSHMF